MATLGELYELTVAAGRKADPRGPRGVERVLDDAKKAYDELPPDRRWEFDEERLDNPYSDTRILHRPADTEVRRVLVGIDIGVGELLLADRLREKGRPVDLVVAHHPEGRALADIDMVMPLMADIWRSFGVPINFGDLALGERRAEVRRSFHSNNNEQAVRRRPPPRDYRSSAATRPRTTTSSEFVQERCDRARPRRHGGRPPGHAQDHPGVPRGSDPRDRAAGLPGRRAGAHRAHNGGHDRGDVGPG